MIEVNGSLHCSLLQRVGIVELKKRHHSDQSIFGKAVSVSLEPARSCIRKSEERSSHYTFFIRISGPGKEDEETERKGRSRSQRTRKRKEMVVSDAFPQSFQDSLERESWALYTLGLLVIALRMSVESAVNRPRLPNQLTLRCLLVLLAFVR